MDEYRGAYKQFIDSPVGKHFLQTLVDQEMQLLAQSFTETDPYKKAHKIDKMSGLYWVRTFLKDMSEPQKSPASAGRGGTPSSRQDS